ncbi:hypothetical protein AB1Y20_009599 [Prymnesium parvum]|uniref:Fe2OG dioxygenase domain-containing protein n=1 Tax=Prymnesium parvum TaxID=97485 RepID=A0AB34K5K0_PRYPA
MQPGEQAPSPGLRRILTSLSIPPSSSVLSCEAAASMDVNVFGDRTEDVREWVFHELAARADWGAPRAPSGPWPVVEAHAVPATSAACSVAAASSVVDAHADSAMSTTWPVVGAHTVSIAAVVSPVVDAHAAAATAQPLITISAAAPTSANSCTALVVPTMLPLLTSSAASSAAHAAGELMRTDVLASEQLDIERAVAEFIGAVPAALLLHTPSALPDAERVDTRRRHLLTCGASSVRAGTAFVREWLRFCERRALVRFGLPVDADLMNAFLADVDAAARRRSAGHKSRTGSSVQHAMACAARWTSDHAGLPFDAAKLPTVRKSSAPVREREPRWAEMWEPAVLVHLLRVAIDNRQRGLVRATAAAVYLVCAASMRLVNGLRSAPPIIDESLVFHGVAVLSKGRRRSSMAPSPWSVPCVSPDGSITDSEVALGLQTALSHLPPDCCSMFPQLHDDGGRAVALERAVGVYPAARASSTQLETHELGMWADPDRAMACWQRSVEECSSGLILGPFTASQLNQPSSSGFPALGYGRWRPLPRFAIKQKDPLAQLSAQAAAAASRGDHSSAKRLYAAALRLLPPHHARHAAASPAAPPASSLLVGLARAHAAAAEWWDALLAAEAAASAADGALSAAREAGGATDGVALAWLRARLALGGAAAEVGLLSVAEAALEPVRAVAPESCAALWAAVCARREAVGRGEGRREESARLLRALGKRAEVWVRMASGVEDGAEGVAAMVECGFVEAEEVAAGGEALADAAMYRALLFGAKKALQHESSARGHGRAGEMGGGRYRCVAPEAVLRPGAAGVLSEAHVATLRDRRFVVVDNAFDSDAVARAAAEVRAMVAAGTLVADADDVCNPLQRAFNAPLWDATQAAHLRDNSPALMGAIDQMMTTPAAIATQLELPLRVPQTVLVAAYPEGAYYRRHLDSYDGRDIPRLLTVLLYLAWEPREGGELRLHLPDGAHTIDPVPGRVVVFWAREVEHEVLRSHGERLAATLWIWGTEKDEHGR